MLCFSKDPFPSLSNVKRNEVDDMYVLPALPPAEEKDKSRSEAWTGLLVMMHKNVLSFSQNF